MQSLKKILPIVLVLLLISGCSDSVVYTFENLKWGSSPQQAVSSLGLSLEDAEIVAGTTDPEQKDVKDYTGYVYEHYDQNGFSGKLTLVFRLEQLQRIQLISTDADVLQQKLTECYGVSEQNKWGNEKNGVSFHDGTAEWWNTD